MHFSRLPTELQIPIWEMAVAAEYTDTEFTDPGCGFDCHRALARAHRPDIAGLYLPSSMEDRMWGHAMLSYGVLDIDESLKSWRKIS